MSEDKYLKFIYGIGKAKPNSIHNNKTICPFCDRSSLTDIICEEKPFLLLKNKYPTIEDTLQTVLIETENCNENMSMYSKEHMRNLIKFAIKHWHKMNESGEFKSVILFKNHGPQSGGSIKHSHMQIVGLKNIDYRDVLKDFYFEGLSIYENKYCKVNISTKPLSSFTEFNVICKTLNNLDCFADNIQNMVDYILNNFYTKCGSFNLFFYEWKDGIICKVVPRFVVSPLFVGFSLKQVADNGDFIVNNIKSIYYS